PPLIRSSPSLGRRRLPVLGTVRRMIQDLEETLRGHSLFVLRIATAKEIGLLEEVVALCMQSQRRQSFARDEGLHRRRARVFCQVFLGSLVELAPLGVDGAIPG